MRNVQIREIPFDELHARQVRQVLTLARDQAVDDADALAATDKFFREMRTDETGTAGDEIGGHTFGELSKTPA